VNKICLGTVKIGIPDYGYSLDNRTIDNTGEFLHQVIGLDINCIDTSPRYGDSERIIGEVLKDISVKPMISTKVDGLVPKSIGTPNLMLNSILTSIKRLNVDSIDICYLHQNDMDIISDKYVHEGIFALKDKHLIKEIGTSVYSKEEFQYTLDSGIYDWVQIPINILDTSFYNMIGQNEIKIAARSVFLQGILLNKKLIRHDISNSEEMIDLLNKIEELCQVHNISIQKLSMAYLSSLKKINKIIIGTTSIKSIKENIKYSDCKIDKDLIELINQISKTPKVWTNPRLW